VVVRLTPFPHYPPPHQAKRLPKKRPLFILLRLFEISIDTYKTTMIRYVRNHKGGTTMTIKAYVVFTIRYINGKPKAMYLSKDYRKTFHLRNAHPFNKQEAEKECKMLLGDNWRCELMEIEHYVFEL